MRMLGIIVASIVALTVLLIGGTIAWVKLVAYPDYSYRYRLTLSIEVDGKVHTGSSVIEVVWNGGIPFGDVGPYHPSIRGQAVAVDLGTKGAAVAALINGESYGAAPDGALSALWIAARAFGNDSTNDQLPKLPHLTGRRDLAPDNMPRLIWFSDVADPKTARVIRPADMPNLFGAGARIIAAYVEITRDPIVIDIDKKLPWYKDLAARQKSTGITGRPFELQLMYPMFVGD